MPDRRQYEIWSPGLPVVDDCLSVAALLMTETVERYSSPIPTSSYFPSDNDVDHPCVQGLTSMAQDAQLVSPDGFREADG